MNKLNCYFKKIQSIILNYFNKADLYYIIEAADWSIKWDGYYIINNLQRYLKGRISYNDIGTQNAIIHYGSVNTYISALRLKKKDKSNKIVLTWFHVTPDDKRVQFISDINHNVNIVHTASDLVKKELINIGINPDIIKIIPLGVDIQEFKPLEDIKKDLIKTQLNIPKDKIIIGSFQKDGVGWEDGYEPKLIKGPDIFIQVIKRLAKKYSIFVLLTGPARGYIKKGLEKYKIPYYHIYLKEYTRIVKYYQILDLYLITSRVEGGPKALLEAMACGVPLISTKVGMSPSIIMNGENGFIVSVGDVENIVRRSSQLIQNNSLQKKFKMNGLKIINKYNWGNIAKQYYFKIYKNLI